MTRDPQQPGIIYTANLELPSGLGLSYAKGVDGKFFMRVLQVADDFDLVRIRHFRKVQVIDGYWTKLPTGVAVASESGYFPDRLSSALIGRLDDAEITGPSSKHLDSIRKKTRRR